jgi:integrase
MSKRKGEGVVHKSFNLHKRPTTKKNQYVYYCQFYDDEGNRLTAKSTGQTSKAAAEVWAQEQLKRGLIKPQKDITFGQYTQDWWVYDRCPYIQGKLARGFVLSKVHAADMRSILTRHILPYFEKKKLQKINSRFIEKWMLVLREKIGKTGNKLSPTTVNRCLTCLKVMLKEAVRLEYLNNNPAASVLPLKENQKRKSILTENEVKMLFGTGALQEVWGGDLYHYSLNLLSATTGMRIGEIRGLMNQYVFEKYIDVQWSWGKFGLQRPKRDSMRKIPIPQVTSTALHELISISPYPEPESFVFYGINGKRPIENKGIYVKFYSALAKIGVTPETRRERVVTFHSWRFLYNSIMRGRIPEAKLQRLTGHQTKQMIEHYTKWSIEDFKDVLNIQEQYFS